MRRNVALAQGAEKLLYGLSDDVLRTGNGVHTRSIPRFGMRSHYKRRKSSHFHCREPDTLLCPIADQRRREYPRKSGTAPRARNLRSRISSKFRNNVCGLPSPFDEIHRKTSTVV